MEPDLPVSDLKLGRLFINHITDWINIIILLILWGVVQIITPFQRYVGAPNFVTQSIMYPYKSSSIPFSAVPVIALVIPFIFIMTHFCYRRNVRDLHHAFLGLLTTVAWTALITDAIKIAIGRPRPHFYAHCFGSTTANATYDATGNVVCVTSPDLMKDTYKSFPSGHTSSFCTCAGSFAGLGYLAMYIAGKLGVFDRGGHSWKLFPVILPILGATFVGITRIDDYYHHWTDVCTGAALGFLTAYFCYRQQFPSLFEEIPHIPYMYMPRKGSSQSAIQSSQAGRSHDLERGGSHIPMLNVENRG